MANLYTAAAGINHLEYLALKDSIIHRIHPTAKLAAAVIYIAVVISFNNKTISALIPFFLYPAVIMPLSATTYRPVLTRLAAALPFALCAGIGNIFVMRTTLFYAGSFAVTEGIISCFSILIKTALTVFAVLMLIATTQFSQLSSKLYMLHIPKVICLQIIITYRYISLLLSEAAAMVTAYSLRTFSKGVKLKDSGAFLGQLVIRSMDRAQRVYRSMLCRGFDGVYRSFDDRHFSLCDILYIITVCGFALVFRIFNLSYFFGRLFG